MNTFTKKAPWILLCGDIAAFIAALYVALSIRYISQPSDSIFLSHLAPFSLLFFVWALVFFICGLYERHVFVTRSKVFISLLQGQIANMLIATSFFYFIPWYGISPKTTLFLYLAVSFVLILLWRLYGHFLFIPKTKQRVVLIAPKEELQELTALSLDKKNYAGIEFVSSIDASSLINVADIQNSRPDMLMLDFHNEHVRAVLPQIYNMMFSRVGFIDVASIYEDMFNRIPLRLINHEWFLQNVSTSPKFVYDSLKRIMDIITAFLLGLCSLVIYPFVALAIKLEDRGPVFIIQDRIGKNNKPIQIIKFRSMSVAAQDSTGQSKPQSVTRVGGFIRKTRIDELPQLWNVIKGDLSLIGPRPELPQFVEQYESAIPFYSIRHLITPGLSGWAQLYHTSPPKFSLSHEDTAMKLSYDLYYLKNRSFVLDITIALKTIRELVSRKGR